MFGLDCNYRSRRKLAQFSLLIFIMLLLTSSISAQTTTLTYQGRLTDGGMPANGSYDFQFKLFDSVGTQQGSTLLRSGVTVSNGVFTVQLDFGSNFPGDIRELEIAVRQHSVDPLNPPYTTLSPRQPFTSTPYAIRTLSAGSADTATNATQLGGVAANQYVQTNDSRLSDSRAPTAGSSNYIQNTTSQQSSSNFNISGNGTAGGTLSGNAVNATTQYNIGGSRVLSVAGPFNTYAGLGAGTVSTGVSNSFFGRNAGLNNTTAAFNSFFGSTAGGSNTTGENNSFFGTFAGSNNTTASGNSFFGNGAGQANTTASNNSFFGNDAGGSNTTGDFNAFFGGFAGALNTTGSSNSYFGRSAGASNTTASNNSFFGSVAGGSNTTGENNSFFGAFAGSNNTTASRNSFFGNLSGRDNTTGANNSFFGDSAGQANTTGDNNAFFGKSAGAANTTGFGNAFFGKSAGANNTTGFSNAFLGISAGASNTTGNGNSFFGISAGQGNTTGSQNSFYGQNAGTANTTATSNSMFGAFAGAANTTGANNSFFGGTAGGANTTGGDNSFVGAAAASNNTTGSNNVVIGSGAGVNLTAGNNNIYIANPGVANESNAIRIGAGGAQTAVFFPGIFGNVITGSAVLINASGQLGVAASSRRYKKDIRDMGNASSKLMQLRPVTFLYRPEYVRGDQTLQYGLIAEEVAKVYPELVEYTADGQPQSVRYHLLNTMLLNEMQKQQRLIQAQAQQISDLSAHLARIETLVPRSRAHRNRPGRRRRIQKAASQTVEP